MLCWIRSGLGHRAPPADADTHARPGPLGRVHADHAQQRAGGLRRGLHPHRAGQGPVGITASSATTRAERHAADGDAHRAHARLYRRWRDPSRGGVLVAGSRLAHRQRGVGPRLSGPPGRLPASRGLGDHRQPRRGGGVRLAGPARGGGLSR